MRLPGGIQRPIIRLGMRQIWLYTPKVSLGEVELPTEEARHAAVSLRLRVDDEVVVFDGLGNLGWASVAAITKRQLVVRVSSVDKVVPRPTRRLTLAVAMPRTHRQAYLVEKCTEFGVDAIWPVIAERSVAKPDGDSVERWRRRTIEAAKQAHVAHLPRIDEPLSTTQWISKACALVQSGVTVAWADVYETRCRFVDLVREADDGARIILFVGPEGGWSESESESLREAEVRAVSLASTVLRCETAAVAGCAAVAAQDVLQDGGSG